MLSLGRKFHQGSPQTQIHIKQDDPLQGLKINSYHLLCHAKIFNTQNVDLYRILRCGVGYQRNRGKYWKDFSKSRKIFHLDNKCLRSMMKLFILGSNVKVSVRNWSLSSASVFWVHYA